MRLARSRRLELLLVTALAGLPGCAGDDNVGPAPVDAGHPGEGGTVETDATLADAGSDAPAVNDATTPTDSGPRVGALVGLTMQSSVGVLLDEFPAGAERDRVAAALLAKPADFWVTRAHQQVKLTAYHLVFRQQFYPGQPRQQLPLPPESTWQIVFAPSTDPDAAPGDGGTPAPYRTQTTDATPHDLVQVDFTYNGTLLTDQDSPGLSEPSLLGIYGEWNEPYVLPLDPLLILQRTGYACLDESEFPPNSVDSEEIDSFYDHTCGVEAQSTLNGCHDTQLPQLSCLDALAQSVGSVTTQLTFTRLPWDPAVADQVRVGPILNDAGSELTPIDEEFKTHRVTYRYVPPDSCTLVEQCIGAPGWRRVLQFSTADKNTGTQTVDIGAVDYFSADAGEGGTPPEDHHVFEYSACHHHWHFTHYGEFDYGDAGAPGNHKRGFCLQSTTRPLNVETSPLWNPYYDCRYQGVAAGWGDEYKIGLDCQWIDVTGVNTSSSTYTADLSFHSNPDGFLCEGQAVLDDAGAQVWEPTQFRTDAGEVVDRPKCNFYPGWDGGHVDDYAVTLPKSGEGFVTTACQLGEVGPLRNCGFTLKDNYDSCTPLADGGTATLKCTVPSGAKPQVVRVCESSVALQSGTACKYNEAIGNGVVDASGPATIAFTCPVARDAIEVGGKYSIYTAPVFPDDPAQTVTCTLQ
jgi:hypothetical protein